MQMRSDPAHEKVKTEIGTCFADSSPPLVMSDNLRKRASQKREDLQDTGDSFFGPSNVRKKLQDKDATGTAKTNE